MGRKKGFFRPDFVGIPENGPFPGIALPFNADLMKVNGLSRKP
jgi:hypothetical protein